MTMLHPNQFQVNEVWIAVKANRKPIQVQEGWFDIHTIVDAASTYIIGHATALAGSESPPKEAVAEVFQKGWNQKLAWPKRFIIPNSHSDSNAFKVVAEEKGIVVENVPMQKLLAIVQSMQQSFAKNIPQGMK